MSSPVDFAAIARQFGGKSALSSHEQQPKKDYAALAQQFGGRTLIQQPTTSSPPVQLPQGSEWDDPLTMAVGFGKGLLGIDQAPGVTPSGFGALLSAALPVAGGVKALKTAATAAKVEQAAKDAIIAYHGSPHTFPPVPENPLGRFDMRKIGTGEGAQAYGRGHYLADVPEVSRGYRNQIPVAERGAGVRPDADMRVGSQRIEDFYSALEHQAARMPINDSGPIYEQLSALESLMQYGDVLGVREAAEAGQVTPEALRWIEASVMPRFSRRGALYQVKINASPDEFLDWDKPLSEQHPNVQAKLATLDPDQWHPSGSDYDSTEQGQLIYHRLQSMKGGAQGASQALSEAGITGIKYLDGMSRSAGQGSRNYVVLDDSKIDILKKFGIALPALAMLQHIAKQNGGKVPADLINDPKYYTKKEPQ